MAGYLYSILIYYKTLRIHCNFSLQTYMVQNSNSSGNHLLISFEGLIPLNLQMIAEVFNESISQFIDVTPLILHNQLPCHPCFSTCISLLLVFHAIASMNINLSVVLHISCLDGQVFESLKGCVIGYSLPSDQSSQLCIERIASVMLTQNITILYLQVYSSCFQLPSSRLEA